MEKIQWEKIFIYIVFVCMKNGEASTQHTVTIVYETYCPGCSDFINNQLVPALPLISDSVSVKFVPFGNAKSIRYSDGAVSFTCQHGPLECYGNMVQDCTLYYMEYQSDVEKGNYVNCEMSTKAGSNGDFRCVQQAGVSTSLVKNCISSGQGINLQLISEAIKNSLDEHYTPAIALDNVINENYQDYFRNQFYSTLCSLVGLPSCQRQSRLGYRIQYPTKRGKVVPLRA